MPFIEIEDFIINKHDIKFINFSFIPKTSLASRRVQQAVNAIASVSSDYGEGAITVVLGQGERLRIQTKQYWLNEFLEFKSQILSQLNGDA